MTTDHDWNFEKLLSKAVLYGNRARDTERSDSLYGFWSALSLEFLARACLSKIHPVLLADPQDGKNILSVFGVPISNGAPVSIPAKSVYSRCRSLVSGFDDTAQQHCTYMARARNSEIHSGDAAFEAMTHNRWQTEHFKVVKTLCNASGAALSDFFTIEEVGAIEEVIERSSKELEGRSKAKVETNEQWFQALGDDEQTTLAENSEDVSRSILGSSPYLFQTHCPSCGSKAIISGEHVLRTSVSLDDGSLIRRSTVASSRLYCGACRLDLSRDELISIGLSPTFEYAQELDPVDHFGVDPRDYFDIDELDPAEVQELIALHEMPWDEPEYGND
mgnify:CR=1 FL=1